MPGRNVEPDAESTSSAERLLSEVIAQWMQAGSSAISVRSLALGANVRASSLYHHFGNLEHLYLSAQARARDAAERWCADQLEELSLSGDVSPEAFPTLLATLIDEWTDHQRPLAFAWRECVLLAARDTAFVQELTAWRSLWSSFWSAVCHRCGRPADAPLTICFFYSESLLHLMRWRRPIDRSALNDFCTAFGQWLGGSLAEEGPWRRLAREEAARAQPTLPVLGELSGRIALAAAALLQREGLAGLTHRAAAAEAGLTLGVVSHNVRTSADLVRAAFEMVYRQAAGSGATDPSPRAIEDRALIEQLTRFQHDSSSLLALDELLLAAARDPALASFVPQLRYLRGRTSRTLMAAIAGAGRDGSPIDHALLSALVSGMRIACMGRSDGEIATVVETTVASLIGLLRRV